MTDSKRSTANPSIATSGKTQPSWFRRSVLPFRKATLRGLGIIMPPLLTIVLFLWAWNIIDSYVLSNLEAAARWAIVTSIEDIRTDNQVPANRAVPFEDTQQVKTDDGWFVKVNKLWIPADVYEVVESNPGNQRPTTAEAYYDRYVQLRWLQRKYTIPAFLSVFVLILYFLGKFFAAGVGRMIWGYVESLIHRLPVIRNVYSSVKQVTDFAFNESEIRFTRVVAVEYPRRGIWSLGFLTGQSMLDIKTAAGEPVVSVLMPTSPMPATGFTINVPKSQTIELNITIDQAIQFIVSCGVVVPPHQQSRDTVDGGVQAKIAQPMERNGQEDTGSGLPQSTRQQ